MRALALQLLYTLAWLGVTASLPQNSTTPSTPELEIVSAKWIRKGKQGTLVMPGAPSTPIGHEGNNPMPIIIPDPRIAGRTLDHTFYDYSAQVINRGEKEIKKLAWDYVFRDKATHEELKRQLGFSITRIHHNGKRTLHIRTASSPPKVIDAAVAGKGSPFEEEIVIQCIVFADGSVWSHQQAKDDLCERVRALEATPGGVRPPLP